jgi:hypothetical protein
VYIHVFAGREIKFGQELHIFKFAKEQMVDPLAWDQDGNRSPEELLAIIINDMSLHQ